MVFVVINDDISAETPNKGGRPRRYANATERKRAHRKRQLEKKLEEARAAGVGVRGKQRKIYENEAEKSEAARRRMAKQQKRKYRSRNHGETPGPDAPLRQWKRYLSPDTDKPVDDVEIVTGGYSERRLALVDDARRSDLMDDYSDSVENYPYHLRDRLVDLIGEDAVLALEDEAQNAETLGDSWFRDRGVSVRNQLESVYRQRAQRISGNS
jgi:hypothetical protein